LRQVILNANAIAGAQTVDFSVGTGQVTINVSGAALPTITGTLTLDTSTQAGFGGTPIVMLDGNGVAGNGLTLDTGADGSTIRGFVIRNFGTHGIEILAGSDDNVVYDNYVGGLTFTGDDAGGAERNLGPGIRISGSVNTIGSTNPADRNVISRNAVDGVFVNDGDGNLIIGNYVGTNAAGNVAVSNEDGIQVNRGAVTNPTNTRIGGSAPGEGNLISGNLNNGIELNSSGGAASGVIIQGNRIGTDAAGTGPLGNGTSGVHVDAWDGVTIGGTAANAGNTIAFNQGTGFGAGIRSQFNDEVTILGNSIHQNFNNSILGIDLGALGATGNDPGNPDALPQNFPVINWVTVSGGDVTINGTLNSDASQNYRIEFFSNPPGDPNEGRNYLGFVNVATDVNGDASFTVTLTPGVAPALGDRITATATGAGGTGHTSEFSASVAAAPGGGTITGTVFEDVVGDGAVGGDSGVTGVTVHLYRDGGDGLANGVDDVYVGNTTTNGAGVYTFNPAVNANYGSVDPGPSPRAPASTAP
jgi:hypothetical protein